MSWAETEDITLAEGVGSGSGTTYSITWSGTSCDITQTKGTSGTYVNASYIAEPRWFAGHKIAFKAKDGFTLTGATIVCTSDDYATALNNSTYSTGASASVNASTVTVTCSGDFEITMKAQARISTITISYEANKKYTITWNVNGEVVKSEELKVGTSVEVPKVDPICGKEFYGWATTSSVDAENPEIVLPSSTAKEDVTYYAVFATLIPNVHKSVSDVLTREITGVTNGSATYSNWSDITLNTSAVYAGNSAGGNNSIQIRTSDNNSGIISTGSGGKVTKVTIEWRAQNTAGRTVDIYGSNNPYANVTSLFDQTKSGNKLGSIVYGTNTELTITGEYEYIGLRSNSGLMYLTSVTIEWDAIVDDYCDFTTTVATSTDVTISAAGYATFFDATHAVTLPTGVTGYVFTAANGLEEAYNEGEVVPANVPLVLGGAQDTYTLNYTTGGTAPDMNDLCGAAADMTAAQMEDANPGSKFYALSLNAAGEASSVGFYWVEDDGAAFDISAGKAYLALPAGTQARSGYAFNEETNAINTIGADAQQTVTYNLNGMRVDDNAKGFVIRNGKKCVVK